MLATSPPLQNLYDVCHEPLDFPSSFLAPVELIIVRRHFLFRTAKYQHRKHDMAPVENLTTEIWERALDRTTERLDAQGGGWSKALRRGVSGEGKD